MSGDLHQLQLLVVREFTSLGLRICCTLFFFGFWLCGLARIDRFDVSLAFLVKVEHIVVEEHLLAVLAV